MNKAHPREAAQARLEIGTHPLVKNQQLELIGHRPHVRLDNSMEERHSDSSYI